ncbi:hypothetical protein ACFLZR_01680, partial [Candidatus Neomarinimicrobiota bacterium]
GGKIKITTHSALAAEFKIARVNWHVLESAWIYGTGKWYSGVKYMHVDLDDEVTLHEQYYASFLGCRFDDPDAGSAIYLEFIKPTSRLRSIGLAIGITPALRR